MRIHSTLSAAIAAVLIAGGAQAADFSPKRTKVVDRQTASQSVISSSQRFVVRTRAPSTAGRAVLQSALRTSVQRAGLAMPVRANATAAARPAASARVLRSMGTPGWHVVQTSRALTSSERASFIRELSAEPGVVSVEVDHLYQRGNVARAVPAAAPNDPNYAQLQWNFTDATGGVRAEAGWAISTGQDIVVAVIDTGVVENHPDLAVNILPGYDMITDRRVSRRDSDDRAPGGWDVGDWVEDGYCVALGGPPNQALDSSWHGSHVSGTVAQETNNGRALAGLAHGSKVVPIRVLGSCGGFGSDIADGMLWAAGLPVDGLPTNPNPAEVLNLSLGSGGPSACPAIYQAAIDQVNSAGSIIVVAAGNSNADAGTYTMGSCTGVIAVGATGITGAKANYSNWGTRVDLSAPGGGGFVDGDPGGYIFQVLNTGTTRPTTQYNLAGFTGTSMASPHVAAAVAMVQSVVLTPLNFTEMRALLRSTARPFPIAIPSNRPMGAGILDVGALLTRATAPPCTGNCVPPTTVLQNKVEVVGLSDGGDDKVFSFEAQAGRTLSLMTYGGTGNVSMHVARGRIPTATDRDAFSTRPASNSETVRFTAPVAGTYNIRLTGTYAGLTIVARQ
ncbi:S8 family serine peptidase [Luteimonas fraxinea]|uniref:S8 family serine peptidase n=1 Tax=Luteimonas fraxinea TaxID=2901869 RepID=A0ABS8UHG3_9GAMM|nr:S8 family peptidase [Luteimonas fraxinea]MCD9098186.1 S8 family serine peptidase [Luteimonas fraxinea]MCD9126912.1 S8 family serine peptidase [Luteimonas fraxinea]UHH08872.1 S8 family serine peptidase [Luteimonas fraxinea]